MDKNSTYKPQNSRYMEGDSTSMEDMKWWHRMNRLVSEKGWTLRELSRRSDVDYESVAKYARGAVDMPRGTNLSKIAYALGVTEQFMLFGVDSTPKLTDYENSLRGTKRIPRITLSELGKYQAGRDLFSVWSGEMNTAVDEDISSDCIAVPIEDNSMLPDFAPGDMVICDPNASIEPGNYVVAKANGQPAAVIRRYRLEKTKDTGEMRIELRPINGDYPSDFIDSDHPGTIIGRCVKIIKNL